MDNHLIIFVINPLANKGIQKYNGWLVTIYLNMSLNTSTRTITPINIVSKNIYPHQITWIMWQKEMLNTPLWEGKHLWLIIHIANLVFVDTTNFPDVETMTKIGKVKQLHIMKNLNKPYSSWVYQTHGNWKNLKQEDALLPGNTVFPTTTYKESNYTKIMWRNQSTDST